MGEFYILCCSIKNYQYSNNSNLFNHRTMLWTVCMLFVEILFGVTLKKSTVPAGGKISPREFLFLLIVL